MAIIGINLGTTNSLAACWKDGRLELIRNEDREILFPSAVGYAEGEGYGWQHPFDTEAVSCLNRCLDTADAAHFTSDS